MGVRLTGFLIVLIVANHAKSQELIVNGGFEEYYSIPDSFSDGNTSKDWDYLLRHKRSLGDPSYYHVQGFMPTHWSDSTQPHSGDAFMGMEIEVLTHNPGLYASGRDYITNKLRSMMKVAKPYRLRFSVSNSLGFSYYNCINCIGVFFSTRKLYQGEFNKPESNILRPPHLQIVSDSNSLFPEGWQTFTFTFTPDSAYQYMTFGNFLPDSQLVFHPPWGDVMIIYYDDFSILPAWLYIVGDSSICRGETAVLHAYNSSGNCRWATLDSPDVIISEDSIIEVSPETSTTYLLYSLEDTAIYTVLVKDYAVSLGNDTTICLGESIELRPILEGAIFRWPDGTFGPVHEISNSSLYYVTAFKEGCQVSDTMALHTKYCYCNVSVPNTFTPNGDGKNEYFGPVFDCNLQYYNMSIYNRWGDLVFESQNRDIQWNGMKDGEILLDGMYVYRLRYTLGNGDDGEENGKVLLIK